jgi:hypothetical protein
LTKRFLPKEAELRENERAMNAKESDEAEHSKYKNPPLPFESVLLHPHCVIVDCFTSTDPPSSSLILIAPPSSLAED